MQEEHRFAKKPKLTRKARIQMTFANKASLQRALPNVGDASVYNVWYDRWYTEDRDKYGGVSNPDAIPFSKCDPERDSGLTRADEGITRDPLFCVYFARGCCGKGYMCRFLHRVPTQEDELHIEKTRDCFGRERHRVDREDMSGVGSFERECRTLHVSRVGKYQREEWEPVLRKHFGKFGDITKVKCFYSRSVAFIKYTCRLNAEFAKEAMHEQAMDKSEVLAVKWAHDEPDEEEIKLDVAKAQQEFLQKVLQNPTAPATRALLHDTQTESDLNKYYQQAGLNYDQYQIQQQWAPLVGKEAADQFQTRTAATVIYPSANTGMLVPPPPPPRKNSQKQATKRAAEQHVDEDIVEKKLREAAQELEDERASKILHSTAQPSHGQKENTSQPAGTALALVGAYGSDNDDD